MHDRIKELRNQHGYTLSMIAEQLDVTEATAQRYETGKGIKTIPYEVIEKYANIFNCSPSYIMGWDQDSINAASEAQKDADNYDDSIEQELQNFMLELSEMGFEPSEMKRVMDYAQIVKTINSESDELHKAFIDLFTKMYKLNLSIDDLNAVYTYAQMLKNNKKG